MLRERRIKYFARQITGLVLKIELLLHAIIDKTAAYEILEGSMSGRRKKQEEEKADSRRKRNEVLGKSVRAQGQVNLPLCLHT